MRKSDRKITKRAGPDKEIPWDEIITSLKEGIGSPIPSVSQIAANNGGPFYVLISTMISLRTKDEVTLPASERLFGRADTPEELSRFSEEEIGDIIYPAGFYRNKAKAIKETSRIIAEDFGGEVPRDLETLLSLPGVGRKTANLVLNLGFGIDAICVDTHVHRISNRTGWVSTKTPEETEFALMELLPKKYWIPINELLVRYGQQTCKPTSPLCSECVIPEHCLRVGVTRSR